jgi:hypothetical protein
MGVGSHMIAGARACSTLTTDYRPRPTIKTNRHYAEALKLLCGAHNLLKLWRATTATSS